MSLVLTNEGKVYSWGSGVPMGRGYYPCDGPAAVPSLAGINVVSIGLGYDFGVAVTDRGDLYCFGEYNGCPAKNADKAFTRLSIPGLDGNVLDIRAGSYHTLVRTRDHRLYAFGRSRWGQLGDARFTQGGFVSGITAAPVLTNVTSFAAGLWHSVALKDDGTVWTWGHIEESELCDGTTAVKRVPTGLPALAGQAVQVAAGFGGTFIRTKTGTLLVRGQNRQGQLGLAPAEQGTSVVTAPGPTPLTVPARSSIMAVSANYSAFSPDGCAVYMSGLPGPRGGNDGVRGATEPSSERFAPRAGLSLCAPRSTAAMPDVDAGALHPPDAPGAAGVECWVPKGVAGRGRDPRPVPIQQAMQTVERLLKENEAFTAQVPERVRISISSNVNNILFVSAQPRALWSNTACGVLGKEDDGLSLVEVSFNGDLVGRNFRNGHMTPSRYVAGVPVYNFPAFGGVKFENVVISKDGKIPVVPVTLADRLDKEAQNLTEFLEDRRKKLAEIAVPGAVATLRQSASELQRQLEALRVYRASFSADELRAAFVEGDRNGPEARQVDARVRALEALSPADQARVNDLGTRARALQRRVQTRGIEPQEVARLRSESDDPLNQAKAILEAHRSRVAAEVTALRNDFALKLIRPSDASRATEYKDDPTCYDPADPGRIQLIVLRFDAYSSRETANAKAQAWMDQVMNTIDYAALKALIR